jgi:hypothetical protein
MDSKSEPELRFAERTQTRIYATIKYFQQSSTAKVIDLSATGIALELDSPIHASTGSRVSVDSIDLGHITGTVQWCHGNRIGLKLSLSTNTLAKLSSYFRFFHHDIKPTLMD